MAKMIVARQDDYCYLIKTGDDRGQVMDVSRGLLFPEFNLESIIARGYWEPYRRSQQILQELLAQVKDVKEAARVDAEGV